MYQHTVQVEGVPEADEGKHIAHGHRLTVFPSNSSFFSSPYLTLLLTSSFPLKSSTFVYKYELYFKIAL